MTWIELLLMISTTYSTIFIGVLTVSIVLLLIFMWSIAFQLSTGLIIIGTTILNGV